MEQAYLTKKEAAARLRISTRTLDRLIAEGQIVGARIGGRRLLFREQDIDGYVLRRLQEAAR
jgi:excisionase family DNA binding protein